MVTNKEIENVSEILARRLDTVTLKALDLIANRIKRIGAISPSDAHALEQMRAIGGDLAQIKKYLANAIGQDINNVDAMFNSYARNNYDFLRYYYDASGVEQIPFMQNIALQNLIRSEAEITKNTFLNISRTTAFAVKGPDGKMQYKGIGEFYQETVDKAITTVASGTGDYYTEMRSVMRQMADSGIRTVDYASGYSRDVYSATKMNVMDGIRQVNQKMGEQCGKEFGADGVEISVHMTCAPDHVDIQGRQYTNERFEMLNRDLQRPIGTLNCRHIIFPVIVGVHKPNYTDEQLEEIKKQNNEKNIEIDGKKYTKYEASQIMRSIESKIRKKKREVDVLNSAGDTEGVTVAKNDLRVLRDKYNQVASASKLAKRPMNLQV